WGVDHLIIDQKPEPVQITKALGVSPRTLELFDQIGVLCEALDRGVRMRGQITARDGVDIQIVDFPADHAAYVPLILPQYDTERIVRDHVRRHGGHVDAGVILRSFDAGGDRIVARGAGSDGTEHTITCRYLVGCDGAHSAVRHGLDLNYEGDAYPMTFMLGD